MPGAVTESGLSACFTFYTHGGLKHHVRGCTHYVPIVYLTGIIFFQYTKIGFPGCYTSGTVVYCHSKTLTKHHLFSA